MQNTPWAEREIFEALRVIAAETETDLGEIIDALTGYAWGEEEREDLRKMIPDILADIEDVPKPTPEPPKPTGEQLKRTCGNCGMPAKDCGVSKFSREACEAVPAWCKEWTPKQPEPVVHTSCEGCAHEGINFFMCGGCFNQMETMSNQVRRNYTPKQPEPAEQVTNWEYGKGGLKQQTEPAAPVIRVCEQCGAVARNSLVNICSSCGGRFVKPKEPKAEPGLIGCKIIGGKGNELWIVDMPWGNSIALYKAVGRKDFDHIELKSGATVTTLQAFDPNDPPVRAWFRG